MKEPTSSPNKRTLKRRFYEVFAASNPSLKKNQGFF